MATSTLPTHAEHVDYEHFIDYQLKHAQGRIKSVELGTEVVRLVSAAVIFVLAMVGLDYVFVLPSSLRLVLLLAALGACGVFLALRIVVPGIRRLNKFYAARTIEQATPEFKNSLINFLDLRRHPDQISPDVLAALEERAVNDLSQVHVDEKISQETLIRASYGLAGTVFAACVVVILNALFLHRSLVDSLGRVLVPTADIQPPTNTQLTGIKPGDDEKLNSVVAHSDVTVSVTAEGKEPDDVTLHWSNDAGRFWHTQKLEPGSSKFDPWRTVLPIVEKSFDYYLTGGDCTTKTYRLNVTPAPAVTGIEVIYDYPEYTGWSRYTSTDGNIDALEGTRVTIIATTNRPPRGGQMILGPNKSPGPNMSVVPGRDDQIAITQPYVVSKDDSYTIWFETGRGETNPRPATYTIKARVDLPPTVTVKPGTDQVDPPVAANAIVPIGVTARDDFGIEEVTLHVARGQDTLNTFDLTDGQSAGKEFLGTHRLDLASLRLDAGDEITYWIDVADNRQPTRRHTPSPHYRIRIGSPLTAEERETEIARSDEAEKAAAKAAEQPPEEPPDRPQPNQTGETGESGEQGQPSEDMKETPKDERALEVIRKFMEEKERERQMEQDRQSGQSGGEDSRPDARQEKDSKDGTGEPKPDQKGAGDKPGEQGDKPGDDKQSGEKPDGDKRSGEKQRGEKSGDDKSGNEKSGDKPGEKPADDKPGTDKSDSQKTADNKQAGEKPNGGKSGDDKSSGDKSQFGKPASDDAAGDKPTGKEPAEKTGGDKPTDGDKPAGQKSGDMTGDDQSSGDKSDSKPGNKSGDGKPSSEKADDEKSGSEKPKAGEKSGDEQVGGDKAGREKPTGDRSTGDKSTDEKQSADKASDDQGGKMTGQGATGPKKPGDDPDAPNSGDSSAGAKPAVDQEGGDQKGGDQKGGDQKRGDQKRGDQKDGDQKGGDQKDGDQKGGDQKGGDQKDGDQKGGDQKRGDQKRGDQKGGDQKGGDQKGGDQKGGDQKDGDQKGGDQKGAGDDGSQGDASGKSKGEGASSGQSTSRTGGGGNSSAGQTERPQPGAGPGEKSGTVQKNDVPTGPPPGSRGSDTDYSREGSDLVLERLGQQLEQGKVDPDLLKRLGWTQAELEQFVKEFSGPGKTDGKLPTDAQPKSKKPTEPGKTTLKNSRVGSTKRGAGQTAVDNLGDNFEGNRAKAPPEYEDLVRAYNMSQSKSEKPANSSGAKPR